MVMLTWLCGCVTVFVSSVSPFEPVVSLCSKFYMDIIVFEATLTSYFIISYNQRPRFVRVVAPRIIIIIIIKNKGGDMNS
jgi:hypothetical protein